MSRLSTEDLLSMILAAVSTGFLIATRNQGSLWLATGSSVLILSLTSLLGHCLKRHWTVLFAGLTFVAVSIYFVLSMTFNGWTWMRAISCVVCLIYAWNLIRKWWADPPSHDNAGDDNDEDGSVVSIVALVKELPFLDATVLSHHVNKAWNLDLDTGSDQATSFVVGEAPLFIIKCDPGMFLFHYHDRPYFDDPDEVTQSMSELRMINVIQNHAAWFSVDGMGTADEGTDASTQYSLIGRLLAEIVDNDCLGLLLPAQKRLLPWEPEFAKALVSGNPLENLCPELLPVVRVADDDPRMIAAAEEARKTFPKFVAAFEQRTDSEQSYAIKAPVTEGGNTEFIWIAVTGIENDVIYGNLANDPVDLGHLQEGDRVRVNIADVNDWMYTTEDGYEGGFAVKVLGEIYREPPVKEE